MLLDHPYLDHSHIFNSTKALVDKLKGERLGCGLVKVKEREGCCGGGRGSEGKIILR